MFRIAEGIGARMNVNASTLYYLEVKSEPFQIITFALSGDVMRTRFNCSGTARNFRLLGGRKSGFPVPVRLGMNNTQPTGIQPMKKCIGNYMCSESMLTSNLR